MANEPLALAVRPPDAPNEDDFQALCAALSASERGRAFLAEYARRNRQADTEALLAAIGRIEARLQTDGSAAQRMREDLRLLLIAIRIARPEIDAAAPATRAAKLAKLLDLFERRIDAMTGGTPAAEALGGHATPDASVETARAHLAVVPSSDAPELPVSARVSAPAPVLLLREREKREPVVVQETAPTNVVPIAEVPPPAPVAVSAPPAVAEKPDVAPALPPVDPLAVIMALSEDERLALFT